MRTVGEHACEAGAAAKRAALWGSAARAAARRAAAGGRAYPAPGASAARGGAPRQRCICLWVRHLQQEEQE